MYKRINSFLKKQSGISTILLSLVLVVLLGLIDYGIGTQISFSVFYVMPIAMASWYRSRSAGVFVSFSAAAVWLAADLAASNQYTHFLIPYWNSIVRFLFFIIAVLFITTVKNKLEMEEQLADTDYLTGLKNSRSFYEILESEVERCRRYSHPFTIAYIDLDNFKYVNDTQGHEAGDLVLKKVAGAIKNNIRHSDVVSRLGGDEFACLFPETGFEASATTIQNILALLKKEMIQRKLPVTFSVGMITFNRPMEHPRNMIKSVDDLMYHVKKEGKNSVLHRAWG